jgi:hypothetical protein
MNSIRCALCTVVRTEGVLAATSKQRKSNNGIVCKYSICDLHLRARNYSLNLPTPYGRLIVKELTDAVLVRFVIKISTVYFKNIIYNRILYSWVCAS